MNNYYDIIYISESGFQQKIIEYLIANIFPSSNYLWLKSKDGHFIDNENRTYGVDLNHVKGIFNSVPSIFKFPKLSCNYLIGTQFTGGNCRFFEAVIDYKELHLIDDGIGTPLILRTPKFYRTQPTSILKFNIVKLLLFGLRVKITKSTQSIIKSINKYYSIYKFESISIPILEISPFSANNVKMKDDCIGYIGQPLVEYGMIEASYYKEHLEKIIKRFNKPIEYYTDPSEKLIVNNKIESLEIADKNEPLESFIVNNGMPTIIVSFVSSALLNLKLMCPEVEAYYCKIPNHDEKRKLYYDIFEENDIKLLKL